VVTNPQLGDHATGLELQIEELVDRRERARREGWPSQVHSLELEITALQLELAETAEQATNPHYGGVLIRLPSA
jgi:hypothetical protein